MLPTLRVPTLLIHRTTDRRTDIGGARWMADQIPGARLVELPGDDHLLWADPDPVFDLVEEFVTGVPAATVPESVLLTVVFTDIVGATAQAAAVGDEQWRRLDRHDELIDRLLTRYRGERIKATGDGVLAVFDGPARAVRWAQATTGAMGELGLRVRAGVHTGEVERRGDDIGGVPGQMAAVRRLLSWRLCRCGDPALTRARGGQPRCEDLAVEHLLGRVDGRLLQLLLGSGSERTRRRPDVREVAGAGHLGVARASEPIAEELTSFLIATPATF